MKKWYQKELVRSLVDIHIPNIEGALGGRMFLMPIPSGMLSDILVRPFVTVADGEIPV